MPFFDIGRTSLADTVASIPDSADVPAHGRSDCRHELQIVEVWHCLSVYSHLRRRLHVYPELQDVIGQPDDSSLRRMAPVSFPAILGVLQVEGTRTCEIPGKSLQPSQYTSQSRFRFSLATICGEGTCDLGLSTTMAVPFRVENGKFLELRNVHPAPHQQNRRRLGGASAGRCREISCILSRRDASSASSASGCFCSIQVSELKKKIMMGTGIAVRTAFASPTTGEGERPGI